MGCLQAALGLFGILRVQHDQSESVGHELLVILFFLTTARHTDSHGRDLMIQSPYVMCCAPWRAACIGTDCQSGRDQGTTMTILAPVCALPSDLKAAAPPGFLKSNTVAW